MLTVLKAAQAISSEIVLDRLLVKLIKIIIENAGAQKGALILEEGGRAGDPGAGLGGTGLVTVAEGRPGRAERRRIGADHRLRVARPRRAW